MRTRMYGGVRGRRLGASSYSIMDEGRLILNLLYKDLGTDEYYGQKFTTILFDQIQLFAPINHMKARHHEYESNWNCTTYR